MRTHPLAFVSIGIALLAGCLPTRDNGADPSLAPHAELTFSDASGAIPNVCIPAADIAAGSAILDIKRGHCLALVAVNSFDPQDPTSALDFRWDLVTSSSLDPALGSAPPLAQQSGQPVAVLDAATVRTFPVDQIVTIQLTVKDSDGNTGETRSKLVVHNTPPKPAKFPERSVAAGGPPWNPGTSYSLPLDASGVENPDGDPLVSICWDRPEGTICSSSNPPNPADPAFVLAVPPTPGRVIATLRESDGVADTLIGRSIVDVRTPSSWTAGGLTGSSLRRIDTGRRIFPFASASQIMPVHAANGAISFVLLLENVTSSSFRFHTRTWPDFKGGTDAPVIGLSGATFATVSPDGTSAYIAENPNNSTVILHPYSISAAGALTPGVASSPIALTTEGHVGTNPAAVVDSLGAVWVSQRRSGVSEVNPNGTVLGHWEDPASNGRVFSIRERPGTNEMWWVSTPEINVSGEPVTIHRVVNGVESVFSAGLDHAFDFAWIDGQSFWIGLDEGMALVNADALVAGSAFVTATSVFAPVGGVFQMTVDPGTQDVIATSISTINVSRITADGTVVSTVPLGGFNAGIAQFIDTEGLAWSYDTASAAVVASELPATAMISASAIAPLVSSGSPDGTGGIWETSLPFVSPSLIQHVTLDGTVVATEGFAKDGSGNIIPLPSSIDTFRLEPGAASAWSLVHDLNALSYPPGIGVVHYDLTQSPPRSTVVLSTAANIHFSTNLLEPSAPIPGSTPFLWTAQGASPGQIGRMTPAGAFTGALTLTTNERSQLKAARSLRTNGLCMASVDGTGFRSDFIPASGNAIALSGSLAATAGSTLQVAAVSPNTKNGGVGSGDVCWSVVQAPGSGSCSFGASTIRGWTSAGVLVASYTLSPAGIVQSLKPLDSGHVWATVTRCDNNGVQIDELDFLVNAGGTALTRLFVRDGVGAREFLDDEVSNPTNFFPIP